MTTPTLTGPAGLAEFADDCAEKLFAGVQHQFSFPLGCSLEYWPVEEIKLANEEFLGTLRHRANIYALFVRGKEADQPWQPVYVGERKSNGLRERITQHLIHKDHRTGSMLEAVKTAVHAGKHVGLAFVKVEPESLRLYVEETIIAKAKRAGKLPWNTHG